MLMTAAGRSRHEPPVTAPWRHGQQVAHQSGMTQGQQVAHRSTGNPSAPFEQQLAAQQPGLTQDPSLAAVALPSSLAPAAEHDCRLTKERGVRCLGLTTIVLPEGLHGPVLGRTGHRFQVIQVAHGLQAKTIPGHSILCR